jgi:sigma-B regulation protein RsbU (phosphoserine phosphatase)
MRSSRRNACRPATTVHLDTLPCGLLQTSETGAIRFANQTFCQWIGYAREELVGGRRLQDLFTMGSRMFHHTHWAPLMRMQGSLSEVKLEVLHRDGTTLPMVLNAVRHEADDGTIVHDVAAYMARDRDRYERELVVSRQRLEELITVSDELRAAAHDRAVFAEQMVGIVSHDLRNPLSAIQMGASMLAGTELPAIQQRVVERISRASVRATRLIADLLDFTQARVGNGISVSPEPIDLHDVVAEAIDELRFSFPHRSILHVRTSEGATVGDGGRLAQLLGNLVSNAVTYGDPNVPITVTSEVAAAPGSSAIAVHNAGHPIAAEVLPTIFEPMTRGTSDGTTGRSVGLGLFIVREIARAHRGTATVTSSADGGTTFTVAWPSTNPPSRQ